MHKSCCQVPSCCQVVAKLLLLLSACHALAKLLPRFPTYYQSNANYLPNYFQAIANLLPTYFQYIGNYFKDIAKVLSSYYQVCLKSPVLEKVILLLGKLGSWIVNGGWVVLFKNNYKRTNKRYEHGDNFRLDALVNIHWVPARRCFLPKIRLPKGHIFTSSV